MTIDYAALFFEGALQGLRMLGQMVASNPWAWLPLIGLAILGVILPTARRRSR